MMEMVWSGKVQFERIRFWAGWVLSRLVFAEIGFLWRLVFCEDGFL